MVLILQRIQERYNDLNALQNLGTLCLVLKPETRRHIAHSNLTFPLLRETGHHSSIEYLTPNTFSHFLSQDLLANCKDQQNRRSYNCPTIELFSVERKATARRHFGQSRTPLDGDMVAPHNTKTVQHKKRCGAVDLPREKMFNNEMECWAVIGQSFSQVSWVTCKKSLLSAYTKMFYNSVKGPGFTICGITASLFYFTTCSQNVTVFDSKTKGIIRHGKKKKKSHSQVHTIGLFVLDI